MKQGLSERQKSLEELPVYKKWEELVNSPPKGPLWGRWNHQYRAFKFAQNYLSNIEDNHRKAALIRMPTGTGKTGIMGLIANYHPIEKNILIVVPSHYLTLQIADVLSYKYWFMLGKKPDVIKPTKTFLPSDLEETLQKLEGKSAVLICTNQTLALLYKNSKRKDPATQKNKTSLYELLKDSVEVVLVDEGHREPAKDWARSIRYLFKPAILFSATPYRNDLRMFRVGRGEDYRFVFKYQEAKEAGVIRDIKFARDVENYSDHGSVEKFVNALYEYYYGEFQRHIPKGVKGAKVIIRCDNVNSIKKIFNRLQGMEKIKHGSKKGSRRVIAIHEDFSRGDKHCKFKDVPALDDVTSSAVFWIHQNKLSEGVDDPDFCLVAFYEPFGNARALVQQLGRVIRNPRGDLRDSAWVFSDPAFGLEEQWNGYLSFEAYEKNIIGSEDIVLAFREHIPEWFYYSKNFRVHTDFENTQMVLKDVRLRPATRVYFVPSGEINKDTLDDLGEAISDELEEKNMVEVFFHTWEDKQVFNMLLIHWKIEQTPYFEQTGFFEISLLPTFFTYRPPYLFYHGSISLTTIQNSHPFIPVEQSKLEQLVPEDTSTIKQISLTNTDLGNDVVRRRSLAGRSLDKVGQMLNDHFHAVNSLVAVEKGQPIHLGFSRGTISEPAEDMLPLQKYQTWTKKIRTVLLKTHVEVNDGLQRYAKPVQPPSIVTPRFLLLDLTEFLKQYGSEDEPKIIHEESFSSVACSIEAGNVFHVNILDQSISGELLYTGRRFRIVSPDLERKFSAKDDKNKTKECTFLSRGTSIQVVTEEGFVYSDGQFYNPKNLWGQNRVSDLNIFNESNSLNHLLNGEKGSPLKIENDTWQAGSVFHLMDQPEFYKGFHLDPDILVCEDMGNEQADFIAVDSKARKIAQIHCKCIGELDDTKSRIKPESLSANKLHEVASQVLKNLRFYESSQGISQTLVKRWNKKLSEKLDRLRLPRGGDIKQAAEVIHELLRSTDTRKEIWIVIGNCYRSDKLIQAIGSDNLPDYPTIQLLYLLQSCYTNAQMVGAQLKVITGSLEEPKTVAIKE